MKPVTISRIAGTLLAALSVLSAGPVITWVPPYSIPACKNMLERDFGGVGMGDGLTYLALQFWVPDGPVCRKVNSYGSISDSDIIWFRDWGREHGVKVMLCIYNAESGWDWGAAVNSFVDNQDAFVASSLAEVERLELDGVEIDLEGPDQDNTYEDEFVAYAAKLADALHPQGKHVTVATFAYVWHAPNADWWPELMEVVDAVTSMGYDQIGSSLSGWAGYAGQKALATVPAKLMIGMPGWTTSWQGNTVIEHLDWVVEDGETGVGIWDAALDGGGGWQSADVWNRLAQIRANTPTAMAQSPSTPLTDRTGRDLVRIVQRPGGIAISLDIRQRGRITVSVYTMQGRAAATLFDGVCEAGPVSIRLDDPAFHGSMKAHGFYTVVVSVNGQRYAGRVCMVR